MSVNNLRTPEDGVSLNTREPAGAQQVRDDIERVKKGGPTVAAELEGVRKRLAIAKEATRPATDLHCSHCNQAWTDGRDAAIKVIEGS